jgi:hypothetical protein
MNMKEKIENSEELRDRIVRDEKLLSDLSEKISEILHGKVEIGEDEAYTFVPFVFKKPVFAPEVLLGPNMLDTKHLSWWWWAGLPVPELLEALEQYRLNELTPEPGMPLAKQIIGNKELFRELSECVSSVLKEHGVVISEDVMYVFSPIVYKKPIFAPEMLMSVIPSQFLTIMSGDQIKATPLPLPGPAKWLLASEVYTPVIPLPPPTPVDGIPAPELLYALDRFRLK